MVKKSKFEVFSTLFVIVLIGLLTVTDIAQGVTLGIYIQNDTPIENTKVNFTAFVDIDTNEIVPVQNLTIYIGSDSCTFSLTGDKISGVLCSQLTITPKTNLNELFGYGYGYDTDKGTNHYFGYGYGYGYQTNNNNPYGELSYTFEWMTPKVTVDTIFDVKLQATTNTPKVFEKNFPGLITVKDVQSETPSARQIYPSSSDSKTRAVRKNFVAQSWKFAKISPENPVATLFNDLKLGITRIQILTNKVVEDVKINIINHKRDLPVGIFNELTDAQGYFEIQASNIDQTEVKQVNIRFVVPDSYVVGQDPNSISLYHYKHGRWNELDTQYVSKYVDYFEYETTSEEFGFFAVGISKTKSIDNSNVDKSWTVTNMNSVSLNAKNTNQQIPLNLLVLVVILYLADLIVAFFIVREIIKLV
jgi:PGF-pre-PGF domain-containing protein